MSALTNLPEIRAFRPGDGPRLADAWTTAAPSDPITYRRLRDLFLLDRNFDRDGLLVAEDGGQIVGAVYGVRRLIAADGGDLEADSAWIPFFFVHPDHRRRGIATMLLRTVMQWLAEQGPSAVYFSSYTPNYFLPGLDTDRYPAALALLSSLGFSTQYQSVAMDRSLNDYSLPEKIAGRAADLRRRGYRLESPCEDDLPGLIEVAGTFNADWARGIREAVLDGMPLDRIIAAVDPSGATLGWAMHGTYEHVPERFGPFGVVPATRGTGLGEVLLHLTLERMRAVGAHSAWFLWTEVDSPAGHLYRKTGFTVTRTFHILQSPLDEDVPAR